MTDITTPNLDPCSKIQGHQAAVVGKDKHVFGIDNGSAVGGHRKVHSPEVGTGPGGRRVDHRTIHTGENKSLGRGDRFTVHGLFDIDSRPELGDVFVAD